MMINVAFSTWKYIISNSVVGQVTASSTDYQTFDT